MKKKQPRPEVESLRALAHMLQDFTLSMLGWKLVGSHEVWLHLVRAAEAAEALAKEVEARGK